MIRKKLEDKGESYELLCAFVCFLMNCIFVYVLSNAIGLSNIGTEILLVATIIANIFLYRFKYYKYCTYPIVAAGFVVSILLNSKPIQYLIIMVLFIVFTFEGDDFNGNS